ncbi:hypothetical protein [Pseudomonas tohonis]|uniref:hypothetical protein n=1 Tax=Pseudomonas tohonis TaxID=2725477 RepID=UPI0021D9E299|nr:hypothetical protein [Pseudomonas tohonis]UXY55408.1 hypothetical protein N9L84_12815 [Pseudomonas tohonis]
MTETSMERARRLAREVAATWTEIEQFLGTNPDMTKAENLEKIFRLQSAAAQADYAYWDNIDDEDANAEPDQV